MRLSIDTLGEPFEVRDDATGQNLMDVLWVDDATLEYAVLSRPIRLDWKTLETAVDVTKVSRVVVNYVTKTIHVNTPQPIMLSITVGKTPREASACDECCEEGSCKRIGQCMRYRCGFGEVSKP